MKQRIIRILLCALMCFGLTVCLAAASQAQADGLEVHFLSVERNDGILIRCGGEDVFIDAGTYKFGEKSRDYLQGAGVTQLKYYIGTHAHLDHVGGAPVILNAFDVGEVIQPHDVVREAIAKSAKTKEEKAAVAAETYRIITPGQQLRVGGATLTCLGPITVSRPDVYSTKENGNCLVLMLSYGEVDVLLAADATHAELLSIETASPGALDADVYKNAHHHGNTRQEMIDAISPDWTIFSTGNSYKPSTSYTKLLSDAGSRVLMTANRHSGNIILRTDGRTYSFETQYAAESLTLRETEVSVYEGKKASLRVTLRPSSRIKALTYISDNPEIAAVSSTGQITGVSAGQTTVRVIDGSGLEATCLVTVSPATLTLRKTELSVRQHSRVTASWKIQPSGSKATITWASKDESIATVDARGRITGVYPGETIITAAMPSGQVCELKITVTPVKVSSVTIKPSSATLTIGGSKTFTAKVSPKNATWQDITWSSADESIVTISQDGVLNAVGVGKTTISATTPEGRTRTARITVKPLYVKKIILSGEITGLVGGVAGKNQVQLGHEIQPADATIQDVTWTSSNKRVATVDENGLVTGLKDGTAYITCKAADGSGRSARIKITFGKNELVRKTIEPVEGELVTQAARIRYYNNQLEIRMTWVNQTGVKQTIPQQGILTLVLPDGEQLPLMNAVTVQPYTLKHRYTRTITYKIPLVSNPRLIGLDLTACDAIIASVPQ